MKYALLFQEDRNHQILVSADDISNGIYSRNQEFVDPEYEFKLQYVCRSRNNGSPYFRLYYSYEEYKRLFPDRATRYEIVSKMRRFQETKWHKNWKSAMEDFCEIEKYIKNSVTQKYQFADAYISNAKTCIEFQHSYIDPFIFQERSKFYTDLDIKSIWLFDLSKATVTSNTQNAIDILEDNSNGFFRISEDPEILENNLIYIQVKSGKIYRVNKLERHTTSNENLSTIRYFKPTEIYTADEFINAIKYNKIQILSEKAIKQNDESGKTLHELWKPNYRFMVAFNLETGECLRFNHNGSGGIFRDFRSGCIQYRYYNNYPKDYSLSHSDEQKPIWKLYRATPKNT